MRSLVSITFDDGLRCQFDRALPILDRYRLVATFFLIANHDPIHEPWDGHVNEWWKLEWSDEDIKLLKTMLRTGHEIGSHTVTHHWDKMCQQPDWEVRESKALIEGWLKIKVSSFAYPFYKSHSFLAAPVKNAGYEQARGGGAPPEYGPRASFYPVPAGKTLDRFNIDCRQIAPHENVEAWLKPGCWHVLTFHGIGGPKDGWEPITAEDFETQMKTLASRRDAGKVEVVTFKDGAERARHQTVGKSA